MNIKIAIILGVLVGVVLAVVLAIVTIVIKKKAEKKINNPENPFSISQLIKGQMVVESLGLKEMIDYIDGKKTEKKGHVSYIVGRVTTKTVSMFCSDKENATKILNSNYYFIEAYRDNYIPVWVKLINCHKADDDVIKLISEDDFAVIDE